jgi:hypothetical protein
MTQPYATPEPHLLIGPAEQTVSDIRAALDALDALVVADVTTDRNAGSLSRRVDNATGKGNPAPATISGAADQAEHQAAVRDALDRLARAGDLPIPAAPTSTERPAVVPTFRRVLDRAPGTTTDYVAPGPDPDPGAVLIHLTLPAQDVADLAGFAQVTMTIEPGDRLDPAPQADTESPAPALTDVLLAERTVARAAVAYAATDPDAAPTTRMQTALAEAAHVLAQAQSEADR